MQMKILSGIISGAGAADPRASLLAKMNSMWDVDEVGSNVIRYDKHQANHINTLSGSVTDVAGLIDRAMDFDGTTDYARTAAGSITGTGSFALCQFVHLDTTNQDDWLVGRTGAMSGSSVPASWHCWIGSGGQARFQISSDGSLNSWNGSIVQSTVAMTAGNTYFLYIHYDSGTGEMAISVDGEPLVTTTLANTFFTTGDRLWWGLMTTSFPHGLDGWIDCINYFNEPLTEVERDWVFNSGAGRIYEDYLLDDPYDGLVTLLMYMNGDDASTTFSDRSFYNRTPTVTGNVQVDTAQSKFGGASALFDGNGDYISYFSNEADGFWLEDKDFTIEAWVRVNSFVSASHYPSIIGQRTTNTTDHSWTLCINSLSSTTGQVFFAYSTAGNNPVSYTGSIVLNQNQWYHIAAVRNGSSLKVYVDGVADIDQTIAATIYNSSSTVKIGAFDNPAWSSSYMNGWIDDLRLTKGVARYTENFTPPDRTFKRPANFNPSKLDDTVFWLDAANRGSTTNQWDDLSGNDNHFTSPAAGNFPTFAGGMATFDGSTDFVISPSGYMSGATEGEIFLRMKRYADNSETGTNTGWMSFGTHTDSFQDHFTYGASIYCGFGSTTRKSCGNPAQDISQWRTINVWSRLNDWRLNIDGTQQAGTSGNTVAFANQGHIGGSWLVPGGGVWFQGDMKQIAMYRRKLLTEERTLVTNYMSAL